MDDDFAEEIEIREHLIEMGERAGFRKGFIKNHEIVLDLFKEQRIKFLRLFFKKGKKMLMDFIGTFLLHCFYEDMMGVIKNRMMKLLMGTLHEGSKIF